MEGEESGREEEVVHRVKVDAAHRRDDQHQEKEKEERDRRKETDSTGQWAWLKFLGHDHRDLITRDEVLVTPRQLPTVISLMLFGRRESVVRKVDVFEVSLHLERKVFDLGHVLAAKAVAPLVQALRTVAGCQLRSLPGRYLHAADRAIAMIRNRNGNTIHVKNKIVLDRLTGRERKRKINHLLFIAGVPKSVDTFETHLVHAVPKQAFLAMLKIELDVYCAAFQRQGRGNWFLNSLANLLVIFSALFLFRNKLGV